MIFGPNYCRRQDKNCLAEIYRRAAQFYPYTMNCGFSPVKFSCHKRRNFVLSTLQSPPIMQMQSALEHFNEFRSALKMTTGSAELDSLIDGIQEGQFYLF